MINEALIKLPQQAFEQMKRFVLQTYFAHVQARIDKGFRFDEESADRAQRILDRELSKYDVKLDGELIHKARTMKSFVKLFKVNESIYGVDVRVTVRLKLLFERSRSLQATAGMYRDETSFIVLSPFNLHMTGPSLSTVSALKHSLAKVDDLLGYLEHELTHLVQYRVLQAKSGKLIDDDSSNKYGLNDVADDKYYNAPVEFDPLIKSERQRLKSIFANKYQGKPKSIVRDAFLGVIPKPEWMEAHHVSDFFDSLKRTDKARWKKAVKLFTSA